MRVPPSVYQCGPGTNPSVDAICGLSLLLTLLCSKRFSSGTPVFPSPQKAIFPNSNSTRNQVDEEPLCGCVISKSLFIFYSKFDRHPSKLVNINRQSSIKLPPHWDPGIETLCSVCRRGAPSNLDPGQRKKSFILQPCLRKETLFYDPNSFFICVYRIGIFFQKSIMELVVLEKKLFVAHIWRSLIANRRIHSLERLPVQNDTLFKKANL